MSFHERIIIESLVVLVLHQKIANAIAQPPLPALTLATNQTDSTTP